jgi:hypothetical protein
VTTSLTAGTYTFYAESETCAPSVTRTPITVTVNPSPILTVNSGAICSGKSFTIVPGGASTYTFQGGGAVKTPTATTSYTVIGTSAAGCVSQTFATSNVTVNLNPTVTVNSGAICSGNVFTLNPSGATSYTFSSGSATVAPLGNTSYTVTGSNSFGCTHSVVSTVTVNTTPTVNVSASSNSICSGNTTSINASGALTYSWNTSATTSSISVSPTVNTTYTVTGLSGICANTKTISIGVTTTPTVNVTASSNTICSGNTTSLTASGASTYSWNTTATSPAINVSPSITTTYSVTGTNGVCVNTTTISIGVTSTPTVNTSVSSNTICSGNTTTITASGSAATYLWSTSATLNSISVSPAVTTTYTVTGSNGSCSDTKTITIIVNNTPTLTVNGGAVCPGGSFTFSPSGANIYTYSNGQVVTPLVTTNYTITGSSSQGCIGLPVVATVVYTNNLTVTITGSNTICFGDVLNLNANGASTYTWSTGATTSTIAPTPTANITYSVLGTSSTCSNTALFNVTVNPLPNITATSNSSLMCIGQSANLTANGGTSYTWTPGGANMSITITPTITTTYSVIGISSNGCSNQAVITQSVDNCTGIAFHNQSESKISVYPNPSTGIFTIELSGESNITILDVLGKIIFAEKLQYGKHKIDLGEFAEGLYTLKVESNNEIKAIKLIKN